MKKRTVNLRGLKYIDIGSIIKLVLWSILCISLLAVLVIIFRERTIDCNKVHDAVTINGQSYTNINDLREAIGGGTITAGYDLAAAYNTLIGWSYYQSGSFRLIHFSLMSFVSSITLTTTPADRWNALWNSITLAYSYFFITFVIAMVGLSFIVFINIVNSIEHYKDKKFNLSHIYSSNGYSYNAFYFKVIVDFTLNLAMVFAFFNFLSTLLVIAYWIFLYTLTFITTRLVKIKLPERIDSIIPDKTSIIYLISVMIFQNCYTIIKAIFINSFGVNLDLIVSIILPIGTVTIIIALFIKNLLDSNVKSISKKIKNIQTTINSMRTFTYINGKEAFKDYEFIQLLPSAIQQGILTSTVKIDDAYDYLLQLDSARQVIEDKYQSSTKNKNYLLYIIYNVATNINQVNEIKSNINKIKS